MIRTENAQTAIDLAEELNSRGVRLSAAADSDLACLNAAMMVCGAGMTEVTADGISMNSVITSATMNVSEHDAALDERTIALATIVSAHVNFAKNVARPAIKDLVERVQAAVNAMPKSVTYNPQIIAYHLPEPMRQGAMSSLFKRDASDGRNMQVPSDLKLPAKSGEEVVELLKTGVKLADTAIEIWAARMTPDFFKRIWDVVFAYQVAPTKATYAQLVQAQPEGADAALACYLLARSLKGNIPEGTQNSKAEYTSLIDQIASTSAARLLQAEAYQDADVKSGRIIVRNERDNIVVCGPVYSDFLEAGGNPALLCANALLDRPATLLDDIKANAVASMAGWERYNQLLTRNEANRAEMRLAGILRTCAIGVVQDHASELFAGAVNGEVVSVDSPSTLKALSTIEWFVNEHMSKGCLADGNVWQLATDLIADHVLKDTAAYPILRGIDMNLEAHPDMAVEEAAFLSTIDYVITYVYGQMVVDYTPS